MEDKNYIGNLIKGLRESKGISQSKLCRGICDRAALVRIESGKNTPQKLLTDALFQRLGLSINKFGVSYTVAEYKAILLHRDILESLFCEKYDIALELLKLLEKESVSTSPNVILEQFSCVVKIVLAITEGTDTEEVIELIQKGLKKTFTRFKADEILEYHLHDEEIMLITLLAESLYAQDKRSEAINILFNLIEYLEKNVLDDEELVRLYPQIALLLSEKLVEEKRYAELYVCDRAINILIENCKISYLAELLSIQLNFGLNGESNKYAKNKTFYKSVIEVLEELRGNREQGGIEKVLISAPISHGHVIGNQIRALRKILGITQEDLSEVCDPLTVSRIEGGRKPTDRHYEELMTSMGREGIRYYPFIKSNEYEHHVLRRDVGRSMVKEDFEGAERALVLLERKLNRSEAVNEQYLLRSRSLLDACRGQISQEVLIEKLIEALRITAPINETPQRTKKELRSQLTEEELINNLEGWPLTQTETVIWNNIGNAKGDLGDRKGKIRILSIVKNNYEKDTVSLYDNLLGYVLTCYNLANEQCRIGDYVESLKTCEDGIRYCISAGEGFTLASLLTVKAECTVYVNKSKEACKKTFQQASLLGKILENKIIYEWIKMQYHELYKLDIEKEY
ncbi:helix-turn-helix domain-containing protein [Anaerosporobacter sp.]